MTSSENPNSVNGTAPATDPTALGEQTLSGDFGFCTMAVGRSYRQFAQDLISDLLTYAPGRTLVVLTDRPQSFQQFKNEPTVQVFRHVPQMPHLLFDKVWVIRKALEILPRCVFLDADVRIIAPVPAQLNFSEGIVAYSCFSMRKLYTKEGLFDPENPTSKQQLRLVQGVARHLQVDLDQAKFIWEYCFYVNRHPQMIEVLNTWEKLGITYELSGRGGGEGEALGIAAAHYGVPVEYDNHKLLPFFKNRVALYRVSQGVDQPDKNQAYFQRYRQIKFPKRSLPRKVLDRLSNRTGTLVRGLKLRWREGLTPPLLENEIKGQN